MDATEEPKDPPTKHEVLSLHLTNMTYIQRKAVNAALEEHVVVVERCAMLKQENEALLAEVSRLTQEVLKHRRAGEHVTNGKQRRSKPPRVAKLRVKELA